MSAYGTKIAEGFSQKVMAELYDRNLLDSIVNRDYEGEINAVGSKLNILNFDKLSEQTYANTALTADSLTEANNTLTIDQYKSFYWKEKDLARWLSYIKNPHATIVNQVVNERAKNMDTFVLGLYDDIGAGNLVGTSETTGTVTITATTGVVEGIGGMTFTAAMVGKGFKAVGHTTWYRVKSVTDSDTIVIEDDKDDATSAYTGGALAGVAYEIQDVSVTTITAATLLSQVAHLKETLDLAEKNGYSSVPDTDRFLLVPPEFETLLITATGVALHVPAVYEDLVKKGFITELQGFKVFKTNRLSGNNTDGYHIIAGHPMWMTFAEKVLDARMEEDLIGDFGTAYKDLFVYGAKVTDPRRHFAAGGLWKF
jgi:hypothetical protein